MPEYTQRLSIPKPLGNETVSRAAFNEILDTIDQNAASQDALDAHIADHNNPHQVTAEQVGAIPNGSGTVTSTHLASGAVTAGKLADGAVDTINRIASGIRTSAGGTEANRLAVTNSSGRVGDSEKLGGVAASSYARKDASETWTGRPTFAAGVQIGDANNDLADIYALMLPRDTRRIYVAQWDSTHPHLPKRVDIRQNDGQTVIGYAEYTWDAEGRCTQVKVTVGTWSRTWTGSWSPGKAWPDSII